MECMGPPVRAPLHTVSTSMPTNALHLFRARTSVHLGAFGLALALAASPPLHAQPVDPAQAAAGGTPTSAQLEAARDFFTRGQALYQQKKYDAAWVELSAAYEIAPLPDLVFNLAQCEEKMGRRADAARHYREVLLRRPDDPQAVQIKARIDQLEGLTPVLTQTVAPAPAPAARTRFPVYATVLGGASVVLTVAGGAVLGGMRSDYFALERSCAPGCDPALTDPLRGRQTAGGALLGVGLAGLAGAAVLLPLELRWRGRRESTSGGTVALRAGAGSLLVTLRWNGGL